MFCVFFANAQGIKFDNTGCTGDANNDGIIPKINGSASVLTVQPCQHVTVTHDIYVKNPTNAEWLDSVSMSLGSCYTNVTALTPNTTNTAFYNSYTILFPFSVHNPPNTGEWIGAYYSVPNKCNWHFNNYGNPNFGDGNGGSYTCANGNTRKYTFSFQADISSTCVNNNDLNISIYISDDGVSSSTTAVSGFAAASSNQFSITLPPTANAGSNQSLCTSASTNLSANTLSIGTGSWTVVSGGGNFSSSTNPTTNVSSLNFGTNVFQWAVSSNTCVLSTSTVSITRYKSPTTASVGSNQSICTTTTTLTGNVPVDGTGLWTLVSGTGVIATPTLATSTVSGLSVGVNRFMWTISNGPCSPNSTTIDITVNASPTLSVNSGTICSGNSFTMIPTGASTYTYSSGSSVVSPNATTNYSVTGTSAAGCVSSNTAISTVSVNTTPTLSVNSGTICSGNSFTMIPTGASTYTYSSGSSVVSPTVTTNYSITGTSVEGCISSNTAISTVSVNTTPTLAVNNGTICSGNSFTIIPIGASTYTYSSGSGVVSPNATTNYSVTGTSAAGCISSNTAISTVSVNTTPTLSVNSGTICSGNSFTIIPTGASTYTYSSGSSVVSPTVTTNYSVTGTSAEGCVSSNAAISTVSVNTTPTLSVNSGTICSGNSFTIIPTGASTYTYSSGSSVVSPNATTNYSVTGTSAAGCISSNTAISTVSVNTTPTLAVNNGTICSGNSFTMIPTGASTYTYSSGSSVVSPTVTTNYSITGTSAAGCVSSNTAISTVSVNTTPTLAVNNGTICSGNSFTMIPTGASTYTYSSGSSVVSPTVTTNYSITGTSLEGCISSNTAISTVTVFAKPIIFISSGLICSGDSYTLSPVGASTYTYSSGSSVVSPTVTTSYSVTGSSIQGCLSSNTGICSVAVNSLPIILVNSGTICNGDSFTLTPSGANSYTISGGSGVVTPTVTTNYSVTGTSAEGCVSSNAAISTVSVNTTPTLSVNSGTICSGNSFTMIPTGASTYTYSSGSSVVSPTVTTNYSITGTSVEGCVSSNTAISTVSVNTTPTLSVNSGTICSGNSFTIIPTGASTYTYSSGSSVVSPTVTTNYSVTGTSAEGCVSSNAAISTVSVNTTPTLSVNSGTICSGNSFTIIPTGASTYTYSSGSSVVSPNATTNYSVTGTSIEGCVSSKTITIIVDQLPSISIAGVNDTICSNSYTLQANAPVVGNGMWNVLSGSGSFNSSNVSNTIISGLSVGSNIVQWTISNGVCPISSSTVNITKLTPSILANAGADQLICGLTTTLSANQPSVGVGIWTSFQSAPIVTNINNANSSIIFLNEGVYQYVWSISNGICPATYDTVKITNYVQPTVANVGQDFSSDLFTNPLSANQPLIGNGTWSLLTGSGNISDIHNPQAMLTSDVDGVFLLTWSISNGVCPLSLDTLQITVNPFLIPQIITPNNDGSNDFFEIKALKNTAQVKLTILNRWGNEVYTSMDYKNDFNGLNINGGKLADDTYYYTLSLEDKNYKGYFIIKTN